MALPRRMLLALAATLVMGMIASLIMVLPVTSAVAQQSVVIDKSAPPIAETGEPFDHFIDVTNTGTVTLTDLTVGDEVEPQGPVVLSTSEPCTIEFERSTFCGISALAPGETATIRITLCASDPALVTNTATLRDREGNLLGSDVALTEVVGAPTPCTDDDGRPRTPTTDPGLTDPDQTDPDEPLPFEEQLPIESPTTIFAPSIDPDQETEQDSGDVDQQMEGSPGGLQNANTGNFAAPDQDITW